MAKLQLNSLRPAKGSTTSKKRVGRGLSSTGTYSGRGVKGQKARSGSSGHKLRGLRQSMLATPKLRGFTSQKTSAQVVNLADLERKFIDGESVTPKTLLKKSMIRSVSVDVKILGKGNLTKKLSVKHCLVSAKAKESIEVVGGSVA